MFIIQQILIILLVFVFSVGTFWLNFLFFFESFRHKKNLKYAIIGSLILQLLLLITYILLKYLFRIEYYELLSQLSLLVLVIFLISITLWNIFSVLVYYKESKAFSSFSKNKFYSYDHLKVTLIREKTSFPIKEMILNATYHCIISFLLLIILF